MKRARRAIPALLAALALGVAACGEEDVERGVGEGAKEAEETGKDAAGKAKKGAEDAEREAKDSGGY